MTQAIAVTEFACPRCGTMLALAAPNQSHTNCPACRWSGQVYLFSHLPLDVKTAESALPEDAACAHHPSKKATAICAGTGDYICSLCTIELNGQPYSAEYLNHGGKETLGKAFTRTLPRPDSQIRLYLVAAIIIPYVNFVLWIFAFLWIPHAFILYRRALRMRREDKLFSRVMSSMSVVVLPILLVLIAIGWIVVVILLAVRWSGRI
ncbi:MAG TPA: hypothetical protein VGG19_07895 [Tepidisphaeraceae bacterium]|jgi:hypothetical protein